MGHEARTQPATPSGPRGAEHAGREVTTAPPLLTGERRTDRALLALARLLAEIATQHAADRAVPAPPDCQE